jgi:glutaredoxin
VRVRGPIVGLFAVVGLAVACGAACKRNHTSASHDADEASVVVRPESDGLLLTWIDDKGDFHVETRVADVPIMGRDAVRVTDPNRDEGAHGGDVSVVDLRQPRADGSFPVHMMTRAAFEAIAVARREATGPTLAGGPPPPSAIPDHPEPQTTKPATRGVVVIYGAQWCGACHDAARYLRRKGIPYVEKDVEADPAAAREMQEKLTRSGMRAGSIPVIDVRGKLMVGFNAAEIDAALGEAL